MGESRLIICNRQYNEIYGLTPEQTKPGTSIQDIITIARYGRTGAGGFCGLHRQDRGADQPEPTILRGPHAAGRPHRFDYPPTDARWRLGRGPPGHHGTETSRGGARAHGALRQPDRARQPYAVHGSGARGHREAADPRKPVCDPDVGPRPLQDRERLARPCRRRLTLEGRCAAAAQGDSRYRNHCQARW